MSAAAPLGAFAPPREPRAGDVLPCGVTLREEIGRGGMGQVFRAHHERLGVDVAVKVLLRDDGDVAERFSVEAHALAKVDSPHVVRVLDFGFTDEGSPFVVTELLRGQDLATRLSLGPLPVDEALSIVRDLAAGLEAAHAHGIVHRDVKPSNVHLGENGRVKLLDFGAAKSAAPLKDATTRSDVMIGTPHYMSPEQLASSRGVDERADVWSLAVVAFELLTGRRPYDADTVADLAVKQARSEHARAGALLPELARFDVVFARALSPDLAKRWKTPRELHAALANANVTRPASRAPRAVVAATLALGVGLSAWLTLRQPPPAQDAARVDDTPTEPPSTATPETADRPAAAPSARLRSDLPERPISQPEVAPGGARRLGPTTTTARVAPPSEVLPATPTASARKDRGF